MPMPPAPRLNVEYDFTLDSHNPVFSALSVLTNLAKAHQAQQAENTMRDALGSVDVPTLIRDETFSACAFSLGSDRAGSLRDADYILTLDVRDWGMEARNAGTAVSLRIRLEARLYEQYEAGTSIWSREINVDQAASPDHVRARPARREHGHGNGALQPDPGGACRGVHRACP